MNHRFPEQTGDSNCSRLIRVNGCTSNSVSGKGKPNQCDRQDRCERQRSSVVAAFGLRGIPPGMTAADMNMKIDAPPGSGVDGAIAASMSSTSSRKRQEDGGCPENAAKNGSYDAVNDGESFAGQADRRSATVSHDNTCAINLSPWSCREPTRTDSEAEAQMRTQMERSNCPLR